MSLNSNKLPIYIRSAKLITEEMIKDLISRRVKESRYLDYKRELYGLSDSEKFKILKHISGFANAGGGLIIFGIDEKDEYPTGLIGVEIDSSYRIKIERLLHECIEPTLENTETHIVHVDGKKVFVVSVSSESAKPYICSYKKNKGFFRRKGSDTLPMNRDEIKNAFLDSETWYKKDPARTNFFPPVSTELINIDLLMNAYNQSLNGKTQSTCDEILAYVKQANIKLGTRKSEYNALYIDEQGYLRSTDNLKDYALYLAKANTYYKSALEQIDRAVESTQGYMRFLSHIDELLLDEQFRKVVEEKLLVSKHSKDLSFQDIIESLKENVRTLSC